jgi:hypothetical protein
MLIISDEISRHYSPIAPIKTPKNTSKTDLSAQELLEVSDNISLYYAPKTTTDITDLTVLAIDPRHIYVYWNIAEDNARPLLQSMNSDELMLRIYSQPEHNKLHAQSTPLLEIPVHNIQFQKKIKVPKASEQTVYFAYIGKCPSKNTFISLVKSNELHTGIPVTATHSNQAIASADKMLIKPMPSHSFFSTENLHYAATNQSGQRKITLQ